jgi:hypothetical protein
MVNNLRRRTGCTVVVLLEAMVKMHCTWGWRMSHFSTPGKAGWVVNRDE